MKPVTRAAPGTLLALPTSDAASREAASRIAGWLNAAIQSNGSATLALSGGTAPIALYRYLAQEIVDHSLISVFFVDERMVPPDSPRSNYRMAKETLLDHAPFDPKRIHRIRGEEADGAAEAKRYGDFLVWHADSGAFDTVILGLGTDGHTASLFPGEPEVHNTEARALYVPAKGDREARITLTVPTLSRAKQTVVVAFGKEKAQPLQNVLAVVGDISTTPGRIVRDFEGGLTWVIDRDAAAKG